MSGISALALHDRYTNDGIPFIVNSPIIEYDMRNAGLNIIKKNKLLSKKKINELEMLGKKEIPGKPKQGKHLMDVKIGIMQQTNETLKVGLQQGFIEARNQFIQANDLSMTDILEIRKDAIFVMKQVKETKMNSYIEFREKNRYTSYLRIHRIAIYHRKGMLDIKGLGKEGEEIHKEFFLSFLIKFIRKAETSTKKEVLRFLRIFLDQYKRLELDPEYYIPFQSGGKYQYKDGSTSPIHIQSDDQLNIKYNFDIIIYLIQQIL